MKPKHIAIFTHMAAGHVYTFLDVCSELKRRGHRVTFPANKLFAVKINAAGIEAIKIQMPEIRLPRYLLQYETGDDSSYWQRLGCIGCPSSIINTLSIVRELEEFYETNPPDGILYDWFSFAGPIFAKLLRCPAIQIGTHFAHHNSMARLDGAYVTPQPILDFAPIIDNFMSAMGVEGSGQIWHAEPINIFLIPREFQHDVDSYDDRFKFVGVTFNSRQNKALRKNRTNDGKPLLLISEASTSEDDRFMRLCVEAFGNSRYQVVFLGGVNNTEVSSVVLPNNFEFHREVSNRDILPLADVAVCQAGMGTTLECLYHGVPVVAVPPIPFNSEVAFRISELGLGVHVSERGMTPLALKSAVDTASMDQAIRGRVRRMRDTLRSNRGAELASDIIEQFFS